MVEATQIEVYDYTRMSPSDRMMCMGVQLNQIARVLNHMEKRWENQAKRCDKEEERIGRVERFLYIGYGVVVTASIIIGYVARSVI